MRRILLDTHALLWWLDDDPALSATAREQIATCEGEPLVSVATLWEIAIKRRLGKLRVPGKLLDVIVEEGFEWMSIDPLHAWAVGDLPDHHQDPFDRMLVAQALAEGLLVITADSSFASYGVEVIW